VDQQVEAEPLRDGGSADSAPVDGKPAGLPIVHLQLGVSFPEEIKLLWLPMISTDHNQEEALMNRTPNVNKTSQRRQLLAERWLSPVC
jgi:hypothetical protein